MTAHKNKEAEGNLVFKKVIQLPVHGFIKTVLASLWIVIALHACSSLPPLLDKPKVEFTGIRFDGGNLSNPEFTVILKLTNPNRVDLPVKVVDIACEVGGKPFAQGHSLQPVTLPAHDSALMELHLKIQNEGLSQLVKDLLLNPSQKVAYHLTGQATMTQLELHTTFDFSGTTDLNQILGRKKNGS
jgi:hypothetical protein